VKRHDFENLIALCPTCHTRYDKREIDRKSMLLYKAQLAIGLNYDNELRQRVERIEDVNNKLVVEASQGFAAAVTDYRNRTCRIGVVDGPQFITLGTCTFVRPRVAIVPGAVLEKVEAFLQQRGDYAAVWEPFGMSRFREISSPRKDGDLRLIELSPVPQNAWEFLESEYPKEKAEFAKRFFSVNETPVRADLGICIGEHVGFIPAPNNTEELRGAMEFQFQDAHVSFKGSSLKGGGHTGYLTPIPSALNHPGAPVFRSDGTLLALLTDMVFVEAEKGGRPVFSTLLLLPELWRQNIVPT
jgi:hypothetical protein